MSPISFHFCERFLNFFLLLADLHGKEGKSNDEYEEIRQQVNYSTTDKIFYDTGRTKPVSFRFFVGLFRMLWEDEFVYGFIETWNLRHVMIRMHLEM